MTLNFTETLPDALRSIRHTGEYYEFIVHEKEMPLQDPMLNMMITQYGNSKWNVVDLLNAQYSTVLPEKFDLYNWLHYNDNDEVAYFLNEVGSNTLTHSEFKAPHAFRIWLGTNGFIIGVQQNGKGFNAKEVDEKQIKSNEGAAFTFFRNCRSTIFFDNVQETRIVFMEYRFYNV
ncbi:hypothetical protein COV17_01290 [Candidatus Woesearchaeota archaeon CG10_big_fil_rev_8_21_14_0_10_36_11]|nr:MAG: hypothetical protein COV17_01290 [Candidatus Woesearchaeota archaeon CG10_big_fil_rev_8_21_14_0_10_36_11]